MRYGAQPPACKVYASASKAASSWQASRCVEIWWHVSLALLEQMKRLLVLRASGSVSEYPESLAKMPSARAASGSDNRWWLPLTHDHSSSGLIEGVCREP